jgi:hypothetical protein
LSAVRVGRSRLDDEYITGRRRASGITTAKVFAAAAVAVLYFALTVIQSILFAIIFAVLLQNSPQQASAQVEGVVVDSSSGAPVRDAKVELLRPAPASRGATTDGQGHFVWNNVLPGQAVINVYREGYFSAQIPVPVAANFRNVRRVELTPEGAISGRISDSNRQAVPDIEVQLLRDGYDELDRRILLPFNRVLPSGDPKTAVRTNENGEYQFKALPPGDYYVRAAYRAEPARRPIGMLIATTNSAAVTYYPVFPHPIRHSR